MGRSGSEDSRASRSSFGCDKSCRILGVARYVIVARDLYLREQLCVDLNYLALSWYLWSLSSFLSGYRFLSSKIRRRQFVSSATPFAFGLRFLLAILRTVQANDDHGDDQPSECL